MKLTKEQARILKIEGYKSKREMIKWLNRKAGEKVTKDMHERKWKTKDIREVYLAGVVAEAKNITKALFGDKK